MLYFHDKVQKKKMKRRKYHLIQRSCWLVHVKFKTFWMIVSLSQEMTNLGVMISVDNNILGVMNYEELITTSITKMFEVPHNSNCYSNFVLFVYHSINGFYLHI